MLNIKKKLKRNQFVLKANKCRIILREKEQAKKSKKRQLKKIRTYGEKNPRDVVYLIHRENAKTGLFSDVITFLGRIKEAVDNEWIPVIDMKNYPNMYGDTPSHMGEVNVWESFFEQPMNLTVDDALESKNVIEVSAEGAVDYPFASKAFLQDEYGKLTNWRSYVHKYIRIKTPIKNRIDYEYHHMISENEKVLGVLVRGSDYTNLKPKGHPIQPSINQVLEKVKKTIKEQGFDKVYLATEEQATVEKFRETFGPILVYLDRTYVDYRDGFLADIPLLQEEKIKNGVDYLIQIALLSKCNGIVAGICSGTVGAALLSEGFEYEYYWDLGYY